MNEIMRMKKLKELRAKYGYEIAQVKKSDLKDDYCHAEYQTLLVRDLGENLVNAVNDFFNDWDEETIPDVSSEASSYSCAYAIVARLKQDMYTAAKDAHGDAFAELLQSVYDKTVD